MSHNLTNDSNIDPSCTISDTALIDTPNHILNSSVISNNAQILPFNFIQNSTILAHTSVIHSVIKDSTIHSHCNIGPFAHIRDNSVIHEFCRIGNFCEIKNSTIGKYTKVSHHSYVGDSIIGKYCNIGCGVIFANYDGIKKHTITLGNNVFVGCNSVLIAPLNIADNTYICANSTVTKDTNNGDLIIGRIDAVAKPHKGLGRYLPKH